MDIGNLRQRQSLPLEQKIFASIRTIDKFFDVTDGNCYLSTSGADSCVLDWLCKQSKYNEEIERVSIAPAEPPQNQKILRERGDTLLASGINKKQVIIDWGYPMISKSVSMALSRYHRTKSQEQKDRRLNGYVGRNGKIVKDGTIPKYLQDLIYAPFELSEKCCIKFKEAPLQKFTNKTKKMPITAELADESRNRLNNYLKHGCIMLDKTNPKCTPMGFWTKQDVLECIKKYNIKISSLYGKVIEGEDGKLKFSGEQRTGCEMCGMGLFYDLDRLTRLKKRNKKMFDFMMNGGEWIQKDITRPMRFYFDGSLEKTNWYWVPNDEGLGYRFVIEYILLTLDHDLVQDYNAKKINELLY